MSLSKANGEVAKEYKILFWILVQPFRLKILERSHKNLKLKFENLVRPVK